MTDERLDLIDGLRRFQEDFNKDFLFRDINPELQNCISRNDLLEITRMADETQKIDKLFFTFIYVKKDVLPLIQRLKEPYSWLYKDIYASKGDKWISDYRRAIQDIPNNRDWNIHRTEYLWVVQQKLKTLQRNHYLILFGKLGFGKRWIAADSCRDYSVISKMNFKIYWINVSKCNTQELVLEKLHRLKVLLQADDLDIKYNTYSGNTKNEIIHMRNYLRKILEQPEFRECLVVLTDVQDENILKAFDLNCKIFITTRHIERLEYIPKSSKITIDIDKGFSTQESTELFKRVFNGKLPQDMNEYVEKFHNICNGHPFIMSLVAKTFMNFEETEKLRKTRCDKWLSNLSGYNLGKDSDVGQIKMSVEESLKFLDIRQRNCYKKMAIFTDNSDIPFKVLEKIWNTDCQQTENIVLKFHKYSLIEKPISEGDDKACSLHYLHYHFLKQYVPQEEQRSYHRHLISEYQVGFKFRERKELDLDFPDDNYFHYFIPYHLVGAEMTDLFDLYLDFGFLEQKIRLTNLPNTVGDLYRFSEHIIGKDSKRKEYLEVLVDFLTLSEQIIFKSRDVTLLQCALSSTGLVQEEAQRQMEKFHDRVWFNDLNHEENHTQIVKLSADSQPHLVRFVKPYEKLVCLISLQDNNVLLHDISQDYPDDPVLYRNELSHHTITEMKVFRHHAFLTLSDNGKLSVYTLKNSPRKGLGPSRLSASKALDLQSNKLQQKIENGSDKITCFNVFEFQPDSAQSDIDLIVGTSQGYIKFYQWKVNKFEENKQMMINTKFNKLFKMAQILHEYVLLLNTDGEIRFIDLIVSSGLGTTTKWTPLESPINLHQGTCCHTRLPISLCVTRDKVVQVTHEAKRSFPNLPIVKVAFDDVFVANDEYDDNKILSSTMSKEAEYLILGTSKGIIVIDRHEKKVIFRRNISDQVLSLDIFRYHDEAMYILSSVFKDAGHIISLYGFNGNRDELAMMSKEKYLFAGEEMFDINKTKDEWHMAAIDSKSSIHYLSCADDFKESFEKVPFQFQIKKVIFQGDRVIVGCTNGGVFSTDQLNQTGPLTTLTSEITYLECLGDAILASCNSTFKLVGVDREFYGKVTKAYRYNDNQLLLVKKNCTVDIIDIKSGATSMSKLLVDDVSCSASAYLDGILIIGTSNSFVYVWKVDENLEALPDLRPIEGSSTATSLAVSADKKVLAIGCTNGAIEIVNLVNMVSVQRLESHKRPIMNLLFSPWTDPNDPLILLSLSESVIFWNIRSIQNNPLDIKRKESQGRLRVSQRFKSPMKIVNPVDDIGLLSATNNITLNGPNPWRGKTGSSDKPELLSCIKLVAKSAKRIICNSEFTRFVTIDNEGNIYHLRMISESSDNQVTIDFNGNSTQMIQ